MADHADLERELVVRLRASRELPPEFDHHLAASFIDEMDARRPAVERPRSLAVQLFSSLALGIFGGALGAVVWGLFWLWAFTGPIAVACGALLVLLPVGGLARAFHNTASGTKPSVR